MLYMVNEVAWPCIFFVVVALFGRMQIAITLRWCGNLKQDDVRLVLCRWPYFLPASSLSIIFAAPSDAGGTNDLVVRQRSI